MDAKEAEQKLAVCNSQRIGIDDRSNQHRGHYQRRRMRYCSPNLESTTTMSKTYIRRVV